MQIKDVFGTTAFIGQQHLDNTDKFKFHSYFVANAAISHRQDVYGFQQTYQGFDYDLLLLEAKNRGIKTMFTTQGGFEWMNTNGSVYKRMPIDEAADPMDAANYRFIKELCFHVSARYGNNPNADKERIAATLMNRDTVPIAGNGNPIYSRANEVKVGLNCVDFIRVQNEYNFHVGWSGITRAFDNKSYAVCLSECIDGILAGDPNMKIVLGGQLGPDVAYTRNLLEELKKLRSIPENLYLDFHFYMRDSSTDQSGGTYAITPEAAQLAKVGQDYETLCDEYGLKGWFCTESGWSNTASTTPTGMKQKAPLLEGFDLDQSAGVLMIRAVLIAAQYPKFQGLAFYHSRDEYDGEPYRFTGLNTKSWASKPRRIICEEFLAKYGERDIQDFYQSNSHEYTSVRFTDGVILHWSNKTNGVSVTPMPTETTSPPEPPVEPPQPTMRKAFITTSTNPITFDRVLTEGITMPTGYYAIYVDGEAPVTLELFKDGVSFIAKRTENGKPLSVGGDDAGVLRLKDFPAGSYRLEMNAEKINFTVGTVTPPPTINKGISFQEVNGKIEFKFEDGKIITLP